VKILVTKSVTFFEAIAGIVDCGVRSGNDYRLGFEGAGVADGTTGGEAAADAFACGKTGAPGAGTAGAFGFAGGTDAEGCAVVCCFNNSLLNPVSRLVLCEYKIDNTNVSVKKIPVSQEVNLTSTLVVWAPKIFSVTPPPKAAPSPSLFGRCIRITRTISSATRT
jgi:hypothetical protein